MRETRIICLFDHVGRMIKMKLIGTVMVMTMPSVVTVIIVIVIVVHLIVRSGTGRGNLESRSGGEIARWSWGGEIRNPNREATFVARRSQEAKPRGEIWKRNQEQYREAKSGGEEGPNEVG